MYRIFAILLASCVSATPSAAGEQKDRREYYLALPDEHDKKAFAEARCIWRGNHAATLSFVSKLERGIPAREILPEINAMSSACGWKQRRERGDIVAALVHLKHAEVHRCLKKAAGDRYRTFRNSIDTANEESPAVRHFLAEGFPSGLLSAVQVCNSSLAPEVAEEERWAFWSDVFVGKIGTD